MPVFNDDGFGLDDALKVIALLKGLKELVGPILPVVKRLSAWFDAWMTKSMNDLVGATPDPDDCDMFRTGGSGTLEPATCGSLDMARMSSGGDVYSSGPVTAIYSPDPVPWIYASDIVGGNWQRRHSLLVLSGPPLPLLVASRSPG